MEQNYNTCVEGCNLPSTPNDLKILIKNLEKEVEELKKTTVATLLVHDGKIAEMCKYIKDNLSNTLRCLLNTMIESGELEEIILNLISSDLDEIKKVFVTPEMFGAYGNGKYNDTTSIVEALNYMRDNQINHLVFPSNKTYLIKGYEEGQAEGSTLGLLETIGLRIYSNMTIDLNGSTLKLIPNSRQNYNIFTILNAHNVTIKNGNIIGDLDSHKGTTGEWGYGVSIRNSDNVTLENLHISKCWGDGINLNNDGTESLNENILIKNCTCDDNRRQGMSIENGKNIKVIDSKFTNTGKTLRTNPAAGVDVEPGSDINRVEKVIFENCTFEGNYNCGLVLDGETINDVLISNSKIRDNKGTSSYATLHIHKAKDVKMIGSLVEKVSGSGTINIVLSGMDEFKDNRFINSTITIRNTTSDNTIKIKGNVFEGDRNLEWNAIVEAVSDSALCENNTMIVKDNTFKYAKTNKINAYVKCLFKAHFNKLIAKNNHFYNGNVGVYTSSSSEIEGNTFISCRNSSITLTDGGDNNIHIIRNNQFEHSNCMVESIGIINNIYNKNIALINNIAYKVCLNSKDTNEEAIKSATRFLQNVNPTGMSVDQNNYIIG